MKVKKIESKLDLKQKLILPGKGTPSKKEGQNGDITIRQLKGKGLFLFYKHSSIWYSVRLSIKHPKTVEDKEKVIIPVGRKPSKKGEISMDSSGKTYVSKGAGVVKQVVGIDSSKTLDISKIILTRAEDDSSDDNFTISNTGAGRAWLHIKTKDASADPYLLFSFKNPESGSLNQWCFGMDNSELDTLKWLRKTHASPLTPSDDGFGGTEDVIKMALDVSGNLRTKGTITSSAGACSGTGALDAANGVDNRVSTFTDANSLNGEANLTFDGTDLSIASAGKVIFGAGDTFISEVIADTMRIVVGNDILIQLNEEGDNGNRIVLGAAIGFTRATATFSTSGVIGDGNDSTDVDFRFTNKYELTLTNNISGSSEFINMIFPNISGNFLLTVIQDGTGSRTVASAGWVAYAYDENLCDNEAGANGTDGAVRWAGGSAPTLTTTANKTDIISIYWDATDQTAFAMATLNF